MSRSTFVWLIGGIGIYTAGAVAALVSGMFPAEDVIFALLFLGLGFPLIAWVSTIRAKRLEVEIEPETAEIVFILAYVLFVAVYLVFGTSVVDAMIPADWRASPQIYSVVTLVKKLLVFVAVPLAVSRYAFGRPLSTFGIQMSSLHELRRSHLSVVLFVSAAMLAFQYFLGNGALPIREGKFNAAQLAVALPLSFVWLLIEVGLVEEFFFRGLLQSRFAAYFKSEMAGIVLMAAVFGLAHVPGFILRQSGVNDDLGTAPSVLASIGYSLSVIAVGGLMFGVVWMRTKNLFALMIIHAATDLLPNLSEFVNTWKI